MGLTAGAGSSRAAVSPRRLSHQRQPFGTCRVSGVGVAKAASVMGRERVERVVEHHNVVHSAAREERSTGPSRKSRVKGLALKVAPDWTGIFPPALNPL